MNSQSHMSVGSGHKSSQYSTNNTLSQVHLESASGQAPMSAQAIQQTMVSGNRYTAGAQWPPRMPPGQHRPLPATYRCTICKKPGHPKNMCPDAVITFLLESNKGFSTGVSAFCLILLFSNLLDKDPFKCGINQRDEIKEKHWQNVLFFLFILLLKLSNSCVPNII